MDNALFISITKYLEEETLPKDKSIKKSQAQQVKLIEKYKLIKGLSTSSSGSQKGSF